MKKFIHFTQPLFGKEEKKEILAALDSGWVTLGPRVKQFEEAFSAYTNTKYAVGVTSCTAGLHLSLLACGITQGDEVITTVFTFAATANVIVHVGAKPVFVDINEQTFNIDVNQIEKMITKKTKAIMPVHYGGQTVDIDKILKLAKKYNLKVIEDGAHAAGSSFKGKKIGGFGDMTVFSFHPVKNMSTGDGGMITTNQTSYAEKLTMLRLHGMSRDAWKRHSASGSWRYDIEAAGYKYNMTDISAALGVHQLNKLDSFIAKRKEYAKLYDQELNKIPEITIPYVQKDRDHIYTLYTIKIDVTRLRIDRDQIVEVLKQAGIGANVQFIPLHLFTFYQKTFGYKEHDFPVAERVFDQIISLPLFPKMAESDVLYICKTLKKVIEQNRK